MMDDFDTYGGGLAMRNRFDGYSAHIAPRADHSLAASMDQLKTLGGILRVTTLVRLAVVAVVLLGLMYIVTYYYLIQAFDFPRDFSYLKIDELHRQWLGHPIGDRDVPYLILATFLFIADNVVWRAGKCMRTATDHSMAVIGAFLACIPGLSTVALPFGIIALVRLSKPEVLKKFR